MDVTKIVQEIQYVLSPAVMVSSSALLLLGLQNKFSNLASRFRALNHEKRTLSQKAGRDEREESRLWNLEEQVDHLMRRATYVKDAIILAYAGIVCFTGTSVLIFVNVYASFHFSRIITGIFLVGLFFVLVSAVLMILETSLFYKIITLERKS